MKGTTLSGRYSSLVRKKIRSACALAFGLLGVALALVTGPPSFALAGELPFEPTLKVSTDDNAAGAHPDVTFRTSQPANHCKVIRLIDECKFDPQLDEVVEYQEFKKVVLTMPEGLSADINAVPKCTPEPRRTHIPDADSTSLWCDPATQIGVVEVKSSNCWPAFESGGVGTCAPDKMGYNNGIPMDEVLYPGEIYMGVPRPGEQAHLVVLLGAYMGLDEDGVPLYFNDETQVDGSVTVDPQGKITTTFDNLPDVAKVNAIEDDIWGLPTQAYDIKFTLFGDTGSDSGHSLLSNPASCNAKEASGEAQGYAVNLENVDYGPYPSSYVPGYGDGTTVPVSDRYYVTGCNQVPYAPNLVMTLDPLTPGAVPAITSTVTQAKGEQNSSLVSVKFAKGFKVNVNTKAAQCEDADFDKGACPTDSAIGEVTAESPLLPLDSGPLSGTVYLGKTDLASGQIKLRMNLHNDFLPNGIDITGTSQLNTDGSLQANFEDVPDLPISAFTLALVGGDKGLVRNPKTCGKKTVEGTFTSHQGKQVARNPEVQIACDEASLQVDASTRRAKAHPDISLTASAASMQSLSFRLPSALKVRRHPTEGKGYGTLTFTTEDGTTETKLDLLRSSSEKLSFSATRSGAQVVTASFKHKKANIVTLTEIPQGTVSATLELYGEKDNFLTNPSSCRTLKRGAKGKRKATGKRRDLNYSATVTNVEGKTMTPTLRSSMACGKLNVKKRR